MKKTILFYFVVSWTLQFTQFGSQHYTRELRTQRFQYRADAIEFIRTSPRPATRFECVNSSNGQRGNCIAYDFWLEGRGSDR